MLLLLDIAYWAVFAAGVVTWCRWIGAAAQWLIGRTTATR